PNSTYSGLMQGYFGNLDPTEQDALWQVFKMQNGFATNPAINDPTALNKFADFVHATYSAATQSIELAPDEVMKRQLIMNVYQLIIAMMESMQSSVGVVGNNIVFLGKYQQ